MKRYRFTVRGGVDGARFWLCSVAVITGLLWLCPTSDAGTIAQAPGCEQQSPQTKAGSPPRSVVQAAGGESAATLTPADENSKLIERNFGETRRIYRRALAFKSDQPLNIEPSQVSISVAGGLIDPKSTEVFPVEHSQITFGAEVDRSSPKNLTIRLCIDPGHPEKVPPGKYTGTILVSGPGLVPAQIPVTLTLKSDEQLLIWLLALAGLVIGIGIKLLARAVNNERRLPMIRLIWMIVLGVGGSVLVVKKLYYDPTTFGDRVGDYLPIVAGAIGAALGGTGIVGLVKEEGAAPDPPPPVPPAGP